MRPALAIVALLAAVSSRAAAGAEATDWFRAIQYTSRANVALRGCSDCKGEPDDLCEVRRGAQVQPLEDYAHKRWSAPGRLKLLRSKADPDCAVPATGANGLFGPSAAIELAAIRIASAPPKAALLERFHPDVAVRGWPRSPQRRKGEQPQPAQPQPAALRLAVVCWPAERGWPNPAAGGADARALDRSNACEWWLLPVTAAGEPDVEGASFPLGGTPHDIRASKSTAPAHTAGDWPAAFGYGDARWARAFDRTSPLDDTALLGNLTPPAPAAPLATSEPAPSATVAPFVPCGDAARARSAMLDRFDQWDLQLRGSSRPSLDRASFTVNTAAWVGHCPELDALRAALEQQLGCTVRQQGDCGGGEEAR